MYKEVAFDPACMASMEYYGLVRQHFGFEKGRYIVADVKAWAREAMQHVKQSELQPVKQQSIKNYLNTLGRSKGIEEFLLTDDRKNATSEIWNQWWVDQKNIRPFAFTISESLNEGCINVDRINDGCDEWRMPPSISANRESAADIVNVLFPLLVISKEVFIVDQYFRLTKNDTLVELFKNIKNIPIKKISIVTSMKTPSAVQVYGREYRNMNSSGASLIWIEAPEKFFHDRYFITDVGAVKSGQGFMPEVKKGTHADSANFNFVSHHEVERTLRDLDELVKNGQATEVLRV